MTFGLPAALMLAAIAVPITVLYVLRVRSRQIPVSTTMFWSKVFDEKPPRSWWQSFRHLSSWLVQMLILMTLVLAAADPLWTAAMRESERLVLVVDNSASMRAESGGVQRLELALAAARQRILSLRVPDEAAIVTTGGGAQIVAGMTEQTGALLRALETIRVADTGTDPGPAIELGRRLIGTGRRGRVLVMTDGCVCAPLTSEATVGEVSDGGEAVTTDSMEPTLERREVVGESPIRVELERFGEAQGNVGITVFETRRSLVDPTGYEVLVAISNASDRRVTCRLELSLAGFPVDVVPVTLEPEQRWTRCLSKLSAEGGVLRAELQEIRFEEPVNESGERVAAGATGSGVSFEGEQDGLTTDNSAWSILFPAKTQRVLLVSPGNLFVQKVLEANSLVDLEVLDRLPAEGAWPRADVIVLHELVPAKLPEGNVIVLDPASDCDAWTLGNLLDNPLVSKQSTTSKLLRNVQLSNVLIPEARQVTYAAPMEPLVETVDGDALCALLPRPNGDCVVVPVSLRTSDLAFRTVFPILISNILREFSGDVGERVSTRVAGEPLRLELPGLFAADAEQAGELEAGEGVGKGMDPGSGVESDAAYVLIAPDGERQRLSVADSVGAESALASVTLLGGPLKSVGIWSVYRSEGRGAGANELLMAEVAVNLANECETNLRPSSEFVLPSDRGAGVSSWFRGPLWTYLVPGAVLLLLAEWVLYQRRWIS